MCVLHFDQADNQQTSYSSSVEKTERKIFDCHTVTDTLGAAAIRLLSELSLALAYWHQAFYMEVCFSQPMLGKNIQPLLFSAISNLVTCRIYCSCRGYHSDGTL
ncbi:hypothetical protein Ancab_029157 [Ancistrocladus abbreviatus]